MRNRNRQFRNPLPMMLVVPFLYIACLILVGCSEPAKIPSHLLKAPSAPDCEIKIAVGATVSTHEIRKAMDCLKEAERSTRNRFYALRSAVVN